MREREAVAVQIVPKEMKERESKMVHSHLLKGFIQQSATAEFKLPLVVVRPECAGILRDLPMEEPKLSPASHSVSPYFMENDHPDKFIKKGTD
jgi:hypothetical protein